MGDALLERREELLDAIAAAATRGYALYALMVTDILSKSTRLLAAGDARPARARLRRVARRRRLALQGVMSRKKQVAPKLLAARGP